MGEDLLDSLEDAPPRFNWDHNNPLIGKIFLDGQEYGDAKEKLGSLATYSCCNKNDVSNLNNELVEIYHGLANKITPPKVRTSSYSWVSYSNIITLHHKHENDVNSTFKRLAC